MNVFSNHSVTDVVQHCKNLPKSAAFHTPVDIKKLPKYYEKIANPMDLGTIEQKVKDQEYKTTADFLADMEQVITKNRIKINLTV